MTEASRQVVACTKALDEAAARAAEIGGAIGEQMRLSISSFSSFVSLLPEGPPRSRAQEVQRAAILDAASRFLRAVAAADCLLREKSDTKGGEVPSSRSDESMPALDQMEVIPGKNGGSNGELVEEREKPHRRDISADSGMIEDSMLNDSGIVCAQSMKQRRQTGHESMVEDSPNAAPEEKPVIRKISSSAQSSIGGKQRLDYGARRCFVCHQVTREFLFSPRDPLKAQEFFDQLELSNEQRVIVQKCYIDVGRRAMLCRSHVYEDEAEWMRRREESQCNGRGRTAETKLAAIGVTESGLELSQMSPADFEALLIEKRLSPEDIQTAKTLRKKLRVRYDQLRRYHAIKMEKKGATTQSAAGAAGAKLKVDYDGLLRSMGLPYSLVQIGKMSEAEYSKVLCALNEEGEKTQLRMVRARATSSLLNGPVLREERVPRGRKRKSTVARGFSPFDDSFDPASLLSTSTPEYIDPFDPLDTVSPLISLRPPDYVSPRRPYYNPFVNPFNLSFDTVPNRSTVVTVPSRPIPVSSIVDTVPKSLPDQPHSTVFTPIAPITEAVRRFDAGLREAMGLDAISEIKEEEVEEPEVITLE